MTAQSQQLNKAQKGNNAVVVNRVFLIFPTASCSCPERRRNMEQCFFSILILLFFLKKKKKKSTSKYQDLTLTFGSFGTLVSNPCADLRVSKFIKQAGAVFRNHFPINKFFA